MPFVLTTDTNPGVAQWIAGSASAPLTGLLFVDNEYTGGGSDGSIGAPFLTIQAALDSIGVPTTAQEERETWRVIVVGGGNYDEDLVFPALRSITIDCTEITTLSNNTHTSVRGFSLNANLAALDPIFIGQPHVLKISNLQMFQGAVLDCTAVNNVKYELQLYDCAIDGGNGLAGQNDATINSNWDTAIATATLRLVGVRSLFAAATEAGGQQGIVCAAGQFFGISMLHQCRVVGPISCSGYGNMSNSNFYNAVMSFDNPTGAQNIIDTALPVGWFDCTFQVDQIGGIIAVIPSYTGAVANDFLVDAVTYSGTLGGAWPVPPTPAQIANISDQFFNTTNAAVWDAGGNNSATDALNRIAAVVAAQHGAIPV